MNYLAAGYFLISRYQEIFLLSFCYYYLVDSIPFGLSIVFLNVFLCLSLVVVRKITLCIHSSSQSSRINILSFKQNIDILLPKLLYPIPFTMKSSLIFPLCILRMLYFLLLSKINFKTQEKSSLLYLPFLLPFLHSCCSEFPFVNISFLYEQLPLAILLEQVCWQEISFSSCELSLSSFLKNIFTGYRILD